MECIKTVHEYCEKKNYETRTDSMIVLLWLHVHIFFCILEFKHPPCVDKKAIKSPFVQKPKRLIRFEIINLLTI